MPVRPLNALVTDKEVALRHQVPQDAPRRGRHPRVVRLQVRRGRAARSQLEHGSSLPFHVPV